MKTKDLTPFIPHVTAPWEVAINRDPTAKHSYSVIANDAGCKLICDVVSRNWKHGKRFPDPKALALANAIAAIPDLLRGCALFIEWCGNDEMVVDGDTIEAIHDAYKKATGIKVK